MKIWKESVEICGCLFIAQLQHIETQGADWSTSEAICFSSLPVDTCLVLAHTHKSGLQADYRTWIGRASGQERMRVDICDRLGHTGKERASGLCEGSFIFQQHCMKLLPLLIQSSGQIILQARRQKDGPQTQHFCQTVVKDSTTCPHFLTPPSNLIHSPSHR